MRWHECHREGVGEDVDSVIADDFYRRPLRKRSLTLATERRSPTPFMAGHCALTLRLARANDAAAMAEMSRCLIETGLTWRYTPQRMLALIADPDTIAVVACHGAGAAIRGFAVMPFGDEQAHLSLLCVQAAQQRQGIGRSLVGWLIGSARVAGIGAIRLELRADNAAALAFYRQFGFEETQLAPGYYGSGIDARRMALRWR